MGRLTQFVSLRKGALLYNSLMHKFSAFQKRFIIPYIDMEHSNEEASSLINEFLSIQEQEGIVPFEDSKSLKATMQSYFFEDISSLFDKHLAKGIAVFDPNAVLEANPYFKALKGLSGKLAGISLSWKNVRAYELYPLSEGKVDPEDHYKETPSFAYSPTPFSYPEFKKGKTPWMSLVPHELMTMAKPIEEAKGKVLTYGLGMGYFAYMASRKKEVSSVTIIESDPEVIAFFNSYLAPLFPMDKIEIVQSDAVKFASSSKEKYDFLFSDINHDAEDGLPLYIKLKGDEGIAATNRYWIEEDILAYLRRYVLAFFEEQMDPQIQRLGKEAYKDCGDFNSSLFASLYSYFESEEISSEEELIDTLGNDGLKKLVDELSLK